MKKTDDGSNGSDWYLAWMVWGWELFLPERPSKVFRRVRDLCAIHDNGTMKNYSNMVGDQICCGTVVIGSSTVEVCHVISRSAFDVLVSR